MREKLIESLERSLHHDGTGREMRFTGGDVVPVLMSVQEWISVKDRLPEEHDSIFSYLYGTKSWQPGMHRKVTDEVIACVKRKDGRKRVIAIKMWDGEWDWHKLQGDEEVTHWMPLPEPPKEGKR